MCLACMVSIAAQLVLTTCMIFMKLLAASIQLAPPKISVALQIDLHFRELYVRDSASFALDNLIKCE